MQLKQSAKKCKQVMIGSDLTSEWLKKLWKFFNLCSHEALCTLFICVVMQLNQLFLTLNYKQLFCQMWLLLQTVISVGLILLHSTS